MKSILVIGSLNMDFVVQTEKLPLPGETVKGRNFSMIPGGKGANQAVAAASLGGRVRMVGRVGQDGFGRALTEGLSSAGVDAGQVRTSAGVATGVALILVERQGQNQITIAAGANDRLEAADLEPAFQDFSRGIVLLQLESPLKTVEAATHLACRGKGTTILDPAPAASLPQTLLRNLDFLTPNETEALLLLGEPPGEIRLEEAPALGRRLLELGPETVVLKLGDKGAWVANRRLSRHFPAYPVKAADTTAAGDTFNGALAVCLAEGGSLPRAIEFANAAAALSVTRAGAQASIPSRGQVDRFISEHRG